MSDDSNPIYARLEAAIICCDGKTIVEPFVVKFATPRHFEDAFASGFVDLENCSNGTAMSLLPEGCHVQGIPSLKGFISRRHGDRIAVNYP